MKASTINELGVLLQFLCLSAGVVLVMAALAYYFLERFQ